MSTTPRTDEKRGRPDTGETRARGRGSLAGWLALSCLACSVVLAAQSDTRTLVRTLASERTEGRLAGSNGERVAADFIISELKAIGAKPLPGQNDFRLPFEFTAGTEDGGSSVRVSGGRRAHFNGAARGVP